MELRLDLRLRAPALLPGCAQRTAKAEGDSYLPLAICISFHDELRDLSQRGVIMFSSFVLLLHLFFLFSFHLFFFFFVTLNALLIHLLVLALQVVHGYV